MGSRPTVDIEIRDKLMLKQEFIFKWQRINLQYRTNSGKYKALHL